jgi:SAM-dependent methyltransferase
MGPDDPIVSQSPSTDEEWERWGARDPYYGVITRPQYRNAALDVDARQAFFASGQDHVFEVLNICSSRLVHDFRPQRVLDFGCGVGRLVIPFSERASEVVGMDVSPSMLAEASANCAERGLSNVRLVLSDDELSAADGQFDLVHSSIVLQHIEIPRGRLLFGKLADKVRPGGIGALHVTFGWDYYEQNFGQVPPPAPPVPPPPPPPLLSRAGARTIARQLVRPNRAPVAAPEPAMPLADADPQMQMNFYNLSELMFMLQRKGVQRLHTEFTDHGGAVGAFLYFQMPG